MKKLILTTILALTLLSVFAQTAPYINDAGTSAITLYDDDKTSTYIDLSPEFTLLIDSINYIPSIEFIYGDSTSKYVILEGNYVKESEVAENYILKLVLDFEKECYKDSFKIITHECPEDIPGCLVYHINEKTVHREITFIGFLEYIKKLKR